MSQIDSLFPYVGKRNCCPTKSRMALVRAFTAKAVYNMPTTQILIDKLKSNLSLRQICGYEKLEQVPSQPTFSRASNEFSKLKIIVEKAHEGIIKEYLRKQLIGHISIDSTAINARDKPLEKPTKKQQVKTLLFVLYIFWFVPVHFLFNPCEKIASTLLLTIHPNPDVENTFIAQTLDANSHYI